MAAKPRDLASVRTAFSAFVHSKAFQDTDLRTFFEKETTTYAMKLSQNEVATIQEGMDGKTSTFFTTLWGKVNGKRTLASYPALENALEQMQKSFSEKEFDAATAKERIVWFYHSEWAQDAEAKALYLAVARRLVAKLTPRQREDLMVWLLPEEKKMFLREFPAN
jgi:hypothetical protein